MLPHTEREAFPKIILRRNVVNLRKDSKPSKGEAKGGSEHANGLSDTNTKHFSKSRDLYFSKEHSPLPTQTFMRKSS